MRYGFAFLGLAIAALTAEKIQLNNQFNAYPSTSIINTNPGSSSAGNGTTRLKKTNKLRLAHNAKIKRRKK